MQKVYTNGWYVVSRNMWTRNIRSASRLVGKWPPQNTWAELRRKQSDCHCMYTKNIALSLSFVALLLLIFPYWKTCFGFREFHMFRCRGNRFFFAVVVLLFIFALKPRPSSSLCCWLHEYWKNLISWRRQRNVMYGYLIDWAGAQLSDVKSR